MAFRIEKAVVRGELCNEERGIVTGRIWLAGRKEPVQLRLRGDCLRDLAGCTVRFSSAHAEPDPGLSVLAPEQIGVSGEMTASRKVRMPDVSETELIDLLEKGQPVPCRVANCLYLEWYSEENGRVVLESTRFSVSVGMPAWFMTEAENAGQLDASQQHFQRFLLAITGDDLEADLGEGGESGSDDPADEEGRGFGVEAGQATLSDPDVSGLSGDALAEADGEADDFEDDEPLDEFEWEQELREADRRAEAYKEALEKYRDHPEREKMIAAALGWEDDPDDDEETGEPSLGAALADDDLDIFDGAATGPAWVEPGEGEGGLDDDDSFSIHHPLSQRAMDFALALQREAEERGLMGDSPESADQSPILPLVMHIISLGAKLAGALDDWARGEDPEPGFIIAMLKRAQVPLNEALHVFDCLDAASITAENRRWLRTRKRDLFELRREILDLMHRLRTA